MSARLLLMFGYATYVVAALLFGFYEIEQATSQHADRLIMWISIFVTMPAFLWFMSRRKSD